METEMKSFINTLRAGEPQTGDNITVIPLFHPGEARVNYRMLGEALAARDLAITEISEQGRVPELRVINHSALPVLLVDGEELSGAKQNRVVNTSILLKEKSETIIPVSCTEQGRWSHVSPHFQESGVVMDRKTRARKARSVSESLACGEDFYSNQGEVWEEIASLQAKSGSESPTHAMRDVFQRYEGAFEKNLSRFPLLPEQRGLMVLINGRVAGFDYLSRPGSFAGLYGKLLKSYIIEALIEPSTTQADAPARRGEEFLKSATLCQEMRVPSVGHGYDLRFNAPGLAGTALMHEGEVLHTAFFQIEGTPGTHGQMAALSRRRRFRG